MGITSLSQNFLTSGVYFRKPFLGLQGHNSPAFVPPGHLAVRERNAHSEYRDSCLVGGCRQNLLLQRRQVCVEWLVVVMRLGRTEILSGTAVVESLLFIPVNRVFVTEFSRHILLWFGGTRSYRLNTKRRKHFQRPPFCSSVLPQCSLSAFSTFNVSWDCSQWDI